MNHNMQKEIRLDRGQIEVVDEAMAQVLRHKSGAERLAIASKLFCFARAMLLNHLRAEHPDWDQKKIHEEAAHRLSHGTV